MNVRRLSSQLVLFFVFFVLLTCAFGQARSVRMPLPSAGHDQDDQKKRAQWNMRGREVGKGESVAALRLRAHQQKMAMRAQRAAALRAAGITPGVVPQNWINLGPAPLQSDATGNGSQDYSDVSGRATSVVIDPADATGNTVLLGGAYGGLWRSTNAGSKSATPNLVTWTPLIDDQPSLAVGAIALQPGNSNLILVGTGETNSSGDSYYGMGILRSTDGGANWTQIQTAASGESFLGIGFSKIAFSTSNSNLAVASTAGTLGFSFGLEQDGVSTARGLYYSTDAGLTWHKSTVTGTVAASVTSVIYNAAAGTFYAAIRRHGIYSSTDGITFTRLATQPTPGLISGNCPAGSNASTCQIYRAEFTVTPGRNEMYVWVVDVQSSGEADDGIWRTTNGGGAWTAIPDTGITNCGSGGGGETSGTDRGDGCGVSQGTYNLELAAIPSSNNTDTDLYAGTVNVYKCHVASGASTCSTIDSNVPTDWINLTHVYGCPILGELAHVHPDQHGLAFLVVGAKAPGYFAHDGGVSRTLDGYAGLNSGSCTGTNQFDSLSETLGSMTEFVWFSNHPTNPDIMLGGTQDNGSPKTQTATSATLWQNALGGDGGFNAINPNAVAPPLGSGIAGDEWFVSQPGSEIGVCEDGTVCDDNDAFLLASPDLFTQPNIDFGAFYTPYILDPQSTGEMLIGTCRIWRGDTATGTFASLSNNFDTGAATLCNGGEVNQVAALAVWGPKDAKGFSNVIYATTSGFGPFCTAANQFCGSQVAGGEVWRTTNASTTLLTNVTGNINPKNYTIAAVAIDPSVASGQTAYVGIMGFHTSHVWKTTNAGTAWTDWTGNLPDTPVSSLLLDSSAGLIYAGTDVGLFSSPTSAANWTEVGPAASSGVGFLPSAPVTAIQMFNDVTMKRLRVSTYGRGIWEFDISTDFLVPPTLTAPNAANPGQSTGTSMTISPAAATTFGASVTYACSGLPAGAACSFLPAQIGAGAAATTVAITVTTKGPFTGVAGVRQNQKQNKIAAQHPLWMPLTLPLAGLAFVGLAGYGLPHRYRVAGLCLTIALVGLVVSCGGGSSGPPPPPPVSVTVKPSSVNTLYPNLSGAPTQQQQFTATVNNATNQTVSWAVAGGGTIDPATGLYTAPTAVPAGAVTVTATAAADSTKSGNATVNIQVPTPAGDFPITVTVTEGTVTHTTTFHLIVN